MRIDVFTNPQNQYGVINHFTYQLNEALKRNKVESTLLKAEKNNPRPFLEEIFKDQPDCTLSFNGLLPDEEGRFFCDLISVPHVACLLDSPTHFFALTKSPLSIITCPDKYHCEVIRNMNFPNVIFMPHGVDKNLEPNANSKKNYDVVMLSSFVDFETIHKKWEKKYPKEFVAVLDHAAEMSLRDTTLSFYDAFVKAVNESKISLPVADFDFIELMSDLEDYVRGKYRVELVKSIKDAKVDVFGSESAISGWKKHLGQNHTNVVIHDPVPYSEAMEIMKQAKIVLNNSPSFRLGNHERVLAGLACGALVFTDENPYMKDNFKDDESIAFYNYDQLDKVNDKVNAYLKDDAKRQQVANKGREIVMNNHTWDHRAAQLLKDLKPILERINDK